MDLSPVATYAQVRDCIFGGVDPVSSMSGITVTGGRLNANNMLLCLTPNKGSVFLDKDVYPAPATALVTVLDADLDTNPSSADETTVELTSTTETTPEVITLTETGPSTKTFTGSIDLATTDAAGILQVAHGGTITATYHDTYDGTGPATVTDTATVDTAPPVISSVGCSPGPVPTRATVTWTTNEPSDSVVYYGTAALTSTATDLTLTISHSVELFGLTPNTTYYFDVESSDAGGNTAIADNSGSHYQCTTLAAAPILFVDDDVGDPLEIYFTDALDANGYSYDVWNVNALGTSPTASDMPYYACVIWNTGAHYTAPNAGLTTAEQTSISGYLDGGGKTFISGQDILFNGVSTSFRTNYLHIAAYTNDTRTIQATGVSGDPISDGMDLPLTYPFTTWADSLDPGTSAAGIFTDNVTGGYPYSAVRYAASGPSTFKMVFLAFPFEAISSTDPNPDNQKTVMNRVVSWLQCGSPPAPPPPPLPPDTTPPTVGVTSPTGGVTVSGTVTIDATASDNVVVSHDGTLQRVVGYDDGD